MSYKLLSVEDLLQLKQDKLSEGQLASANSGITQLKVVANENHISNSGIHVTAEQKAAWSAKQDAIAAFLKDAVVNGGVLTITKKDGSTVQFQGESSAWADITGKPQSFTPTAHQHTKSQITDFGGPYLPTSGGELFKEGDFCILKVGGELSDIQGNKKISVGKINVMGAAEEGEFIPSSITKDGKEVATEDQLPYPIASVTNGALNDRTVNTSTTGGTFTFPAKVGTKSRDFSLVIPEQSTAPSVSFPTTGVTYVSEQSASELWSAEANKINEWYFHENGANQFAVYHRAFSTVTQASS